MVLGPLLFWRRDGKPAITPAELEDRRQRQAEWREFRKEYLYSQKALSEALKISLREVQYVESGTVTLTFTNQKHFQDLKTQCKATARKQAA
jgi:hypothetical protein